MTVHWLTRLLLLQGWVVAALWCWRGFGTAFGLPGVTDLLSREYDAAAMNGPMLTVIVPAKDEASHVEECLRSLIGQEYGSLRIVAVDDRSTDGTGAIMERLAAEYPERLRVIHIEQLPAGWLGKTHAMAVAAKSVASEYLLFTDADIIFRADALRRSMAYAVKSEADHLVTVPTLVLKRWDESALLGFFQVCAIWASRPWKVADPRAKRDAVGVGAFNLMRRDAYVKVGGFKALRMEIVEDLGIARRVKRAGLRQRIAFGRDLVSVHWAPGAFGVVKILTKNMFSAFGFRIWLLLGACGWLAGVCVLPFAGLMVSAMFAPMFAPGFVTAVAMAAAYRAIGRYSGISVWYVLAVPFAALLLIYALLRSMVTTLGQGGVVWRGTFYPLAELRKSAGPMW